MGVDLTGNNKPWELSLYELNRKPQPLITDDSEIAVKPRSLQSELMCPICLDMLKATMTTKECLHRFCQECITTALRSGNKECPTCRKKLVSRRSLRPDPNFDMLISKIYPSREDYEKNQEVIGYKENTSRRNNRANRSASNQGKLFLFYSFIFVLFYSILFYFILFSSLFFFYLFIVYFFI